MYIIKVFLLYDITKIIEASRLLSTKKSYKFIRDY